MPIATQPAAPQNASAQIESAVRGAIGKAGLALAASPAQRAELLRLYGTDADTMQWLDSEHKPSDAARAALALLADAATDGLRPADYRADKLAADATRWQSASNTPSFEALADWDVGLSLGLLHYLRDLHFGRVDPKTLGFRVTPRAADEHELAAELRAALDAPGPASAKASQLSSLADRMAPPLPQYRLLRSELARYRRLSDDGFSPLASAQTIRPGQDFAEAPNLQHRLVKLGDLDDGRPEAPGRYDGALVEAVMRFQARHGLEADGLIGKETLAALNVKPSARTRQIELAMERLRWLPHRAERAFVAINIPMFRLWARDPSAAPEAPVLGMGVIVGRALKTQTPVFSDDMRYLIFRPYWNIPKSILRNEVLPAIARNPGYLARNDMEIVRGPGDDATPVAASQANLELLRAGALRLRQRPGPRNALGLVKFIFPNDDAIYLHDTPKPQLFSHSRRDFSHGCVRVQDPVALAEWVLKGQPEWTRERIVAAMASGGRPLRVDLAAPLPVILYYVTALVLPPQGQVHFAADIYGHDARLAAALARPGRR